MKFRSCLPPKKRDWKPGDVQIGVFYRGPTGAMIELTSNAATNKEKVAVSKLIHAMSSAMAEANKK